MRRQPFVNFQELYLTERFDSGFLHCSYLTNSSLRGCAFGNQIGR